MKNLILGAVLFFGIHTYAAQAKETVSHKVQSSETLFRISLLYNSTVSDITSANPDIDLKKLKAGTIIKVPKDTKVRDAAFVESLLKGGVNQNITVGTAKTDPQPPKKDKPKSTEASTPATADANVDIADENPFMATVKKTKTETVASSFDNMPTDNKTEANAAPIEKTTTPKKEINKASEVQEMNLNPAQYESDELQSRYMELKRLSSDDPSIKVIDLSKLKLDAKMYQEKIKEINDDINLSQVMVINLQIVMKDGSVKTIKSPDEQKKILAQLVSGEMAN
jgi:LysM repeat protein